MIHELLTCDHHEMDFPRLYQERLQKGLRAACGRSLAGHGYEAEEVCAAVMHYYLSAGIIEFLKAHGSEHPEFTEMFRKNLENQRASLENGDTIMAFGKDLQEEYINIQANAGEINNVFVYGTLMQGHIHHDHFLKQDGCRFISNAFLPGYNLYDLGSYPGICLQSHSDASAIGNTSGVFGELYEVNPDTITYLDRLECEGELYQRVAVRGKALDRLSGQSEWTLAWTYVYLPKLDKAQPVAIAEQPWRAEESQKVKNRYVWYVAYGSNLHADRLKYYIQGGWFPDLGKEYKGCDDPTLPLLSVKCNIPYSMYFGYHAICFEDRGVCFLDTTKEGKALGRAYLITKQQFEQIHVQEGRSTMWYDKVVKLDAIAGVPAATFTNHTRLGGMDPSLKYRSIVKKGLIETYGEGMNDQEIEAYLDSCSKL